MRRIAIAMAAVLGLATAAGAATLTVTADQLFYNVGDTIHLTITGDSEGASALAIIGRLDYSAALTQTVTSSQPVLTAFGGAATWTQGVLTNGDGFATVFNQLSAFGLSPAPIDQVLVSTATLVAEAPGVVEFTWNANLDFFGITSGTAPNPALTIIIPEPAVAGLLGLGLFGLALATRGRGTAPRPGRS